MNTYKYGAYDCPNSFTSLFFFLKLIIVSFNFLDYLCTYFYVRMGNFSPTLQKLHELSLMILFSRITDIRKPASFVLLWHLPPSVPLLYSRFMPQLSVQDLSLSSFQRILWFLDQISSFLAYFLI